MLKKTVVLILSLLSFNASALTCTGTIETVGVTSGGDVEITGAFIGDLVLRICQGASVSTPHNLSAEMGYNHDGYANICKSWLTVAEVSVATNTPVSIEYSTGSDCATLPDKESSLIPSKISLVNSGP